MIVDTTAIDGAVQDYCDAVRSTETPKRSRTAWKQQAKNAPSVGKRPLDPQFWYENMPRPTRPPGK